MSWWPVPDSDEDIIGDGPADAVGLGFEQLADHRSREGRDKPTLGEVAAALEAALKRANLLDPTTSTGYVTVSGVRPATQVSEDLARTMTAIIGRLTASYRRDLGRDPRLVEVLYTFTFVFGARPETMVSGDVPSDIDFTAP